MARGKSRGSEGGKQIPIQDAERVIGGELRAEASQIFDLIHRINPSNTPGLTEKEKKSRYAQKSRLQSLLIREFRDSIEVQAIAGKPGLVGLRHRFSKSDACHAIISELEMPARFWVESELAKH